VTDCFVIFIDAVLEAANGKCEVTVAQVQLAVTTKLSNMKKKSKKLQN
jgi:hypothetical protein